MSRTGCRHHARVERQMSSSDRRVSGHRPVLTTTTFGKAVEHRSWHNQVTLIPLSLNTAAYQFKLFPAYSDYNDNDDDEDDVLNFVTLSLFKFR